MNLTKVLKYSTTSPFGSPYLHHKSIFEHDTYQIPTSCLALKPPFSTNSFWADRICAYLHPNYPSTYPDDQLPYPRPIAPLRELMCDMLLNYNSPRTCQWQWPLQVTVHDISLLSAFRPFSRPHPLHHFICTGTKYFICNCRTGPLSNRSKFYSNAGL